MINWRDFVNDDEIDFVMSGIAEAKIQGYAKVEYTIQDGKLLYKRKETETEKFTGGDLRKQSRAVTGDG